VELLVVSWTAYARTVAEEEQREAATPDGPKSLRVTRNVTLPMSEIGWRATTSGGPGGQHANRTSSRVEVWFDVEASTTLGPRQRARLVHRIGPMVRASAAEERSQARNRQVALERLAHRIADGLKHETPRRPTRPTVGSKERRLSSKHRRADIKKGRRAPGPDE
jgi:ribosome-associated protein